MKINVTKLTDEDDIRNAASFTSGHESRITAERAYSTEHSIIRTQMFKVEMIGIPTFVSVHFVRHKIGTEHFVKSNRDDRGGDGNADRNTPVNHVMYINAQALINISQMRLCAKAHPETRKVMQAIRAEVAKVDAALAKFMVPKCLYRGGICCEPKSCGYNKTDIFKKQLMEYRLNFV